MLGLMAGQLRSAVQMVDAVIAADARQQQQEQQRHQVGGRGAAARRLLAAPAHKRKRIKGTERI